MPDDARELDALLEDRGGGWWSAFFADRARDSANPCLFLVDWPDESLVSWFREGLLAPGRVLELGCGNGRNAVHLASLGCTVDAVDFSERAAEWTRQRARSAGAAVTVQCCSIFDAAFPDRSYDLVYPRARTPADARDERKGHVFRPGLPLGAAGQQAPIAFSCRPRRGG